MHSITAVSEDAILEQQAVLRDLESRMLREVGIISRPFGGKSRSLDKVLSNNRQQHSIG